MIGFGNLSQDGPAFLQRILGILEEQLAGYRQRNPASGAIQQTRPDLFLERTDLGGNGRLRAIALFRRPRETGEPSHFEEDFELIEVHREPSEPVDTDNYKQPCTGTKGV